MTVFEQCRPELVEFLVDKESIFNVNELTSSKKIKIKCPVCGEINEKQFKTFIKTGLSEKNCDNCNSFQKHFPNKVIFLKNKEDGLLRRQSHKKVICKCPIEGCGYEKEMQLSNLANRNYKCNRCISLETKRPDLVGYLVNEEDRKLASHSNKKIFCKCIFCGFKKQICLKDLNNQGFGCPQCSSRISIPEKFTFLVLSKLNVDFIKEYSPSWASNKRYDFYIPSLSMIIETHGAQHYMDTSWSKIDDIQNNDLLKKELALSNEIVNYIVIDCRKSEKDLIISNLKNSLCDFLKMDELNFDELWIESITNDLVTKVCQDYSENILTIKQICDKYDINKMTVNNYVNRMNIKKRRGS